MPLLLRPYFSTTVTPDRNVLGLPTARRIEVGGAPGTRP